MDPKEAIRFLIRSFRPKSVSDVEVLIRRYRDCDDVLSAKQVVDALFEAVCVRLNQHPAMKSPFARQFESMLRNLSVDELEALRLRLEASAMIMQDQLGFEQDTSMTTNDERAEPVSATDMSIVQSSRSDLSMAESGEAYRARKLSESIEPIEKPQFETSDEEENLPLPSRKTKWVRKTRRLTRMNVQN